MSDATTTEGKSTITAHLSRLAFCASTGDFGTPIAGAGFAEVGRVDIVEASVAVGEEGELVRLRLVRVDVNRTRPEAGLVLGFNETHGGCVGELGGDGVAFGCVKRRQA